MTQYGFPVRPPAPPPPRPRRKVNGWALGLGIGCSAMLLVTALVVVLAVLGFRGLFDLDNRLSAQDLDDLEAAISAELPRDYRVTDVYGSGSSCEQLCQQIHVNLETPQVVTGDAVRDLLTATRARYDDMGKDGSVHFCFLSDSGEYLSDDDERTPYAQSIHDAFREAGLTDDDGDPDTVDDYWDYDDCIIVRTDRMPSS